MADINRKVINTADIDGTDEFVEEAFRLLAAEEWSGAEIYCDGVLEDDPDNVKVCLCKLMAKLHCKTKAELGEVKYPFDGDPLYEKITSLCSIELRAELKSYILAIKARNAKNGEDAEAVYQSALKKQAKGNYKNLTEAVMEFSSIIDFRDSKEHIEACQSRLKELKAAGKTGSSPKKFILGFVSAMVVVAIAFVIAVEVLSGEDARLEDAPNEGEVPEITIFSINDYGEITFFNSEMYNDEPYLAIPSEINGIAVRSIGDGVFEGCKSLRSVKMSYGVMSIGNGAFAGCTELRDISLPSSLTKIGNGAFQDCSSLSRIEIPEGVSIIEATTFLSCRSLESIKIPSGVTVIGDSAFKYCTALMNVQFPDTLEMIGSSAFEDCGSLFQVDIPSSVSHIYEHAFYGCISIGELNLSDGITMIGDAAFKGCEGIKSIHIPSSVNDFGYDVFANCNIVNAVAEATYFTSIPKNALESAVITGGYIIEPMTFKDAYNLSYVEIPEGMEIIGESAFDACLNLKNIYIPASVNSIGENAFVSCPLEKVTMSTTHISAIPKYNLVSVTLTDGESLDVEAFAFCENLTYITLHEGLKSISDSAFYGCERLESIHIPASVISVSAYPFAKCPSLASITVDVNNTVLMSYENCLIDKNTKYLLAGCKNSMIPDDGSVTSIGAYAFYGVTGLESLYIPAAVTEIDNTAFNDCPNLSNITVDAQNTKYYSEGECIIDSERGMLVLGCRNSVIPDDGRVTSIGDRAFLGATGLTSITIPDGVVSICDYAFSGCTSLESVSISSSVTNIGMCAFQVCEGLTSVTFEDADGWYVTQDDLDYENKENGYSVDVTSSAANYELLKMTYLEYYWYKI